MGQFGTYWEQNILRTITGSQVATQQTYWLAACTAPPMTAGGTNVALMEVQTNSGAYARVAISTNMWQAVSGSSPAVVRNTTIINFATAAGAAWGTVAYFALMNTSTWRQGEVLAWGACTNTTVGTGDTLRIGTASLTISIT